MPVFRRTGEGRREFALSADPALDDYALASARDAAVDGEWWPARDLLLGTGEDWDRRTHRVMILAEAAAPRVAWVDKWLATEPDNPDALIVRGHAEIIRSWLARVADSTPGLPLGTPDADRSFVRAARDAEGLCREVADLTPADPMPWISLLLLARTRADPPAVFWTRWRELRARDPYSREGHHQAMQYLSAAWRGSHEQMFDFAYEAAEEAPRASALAALPVCAHAEFYAHVTAGGPDNQSAHPDHWQHPRIQADVDRVREQWLTSRPPDHARVLVDHNYLAHALCQGGRLAEAVAHFEVIGPYATERPWAYTDPDPAAAFLDARHRSMRHT